MQSGYWEEIRFEKGFKNIRCKLDCDSSRKQNHTLHKSVSSRISKLDNQKMYDDNLPVFFSNIF